MLGVPWSVVKMAFDIPSNSFSSIASAFYHVWVREKLTWVKKKSLGFEV
jgi:hypothetical protein